MVEKNIKVDAIPFSKDKLVEEQLTIELEKGAISNQSTTASGSSQTTTASSQPTVAAATEEKLSSETASLRVTESATEPPTRMAENFNSYRVDPSPGGGGQTGQQRSPLGGASGMNHVEIHGNNTVLNISPTINYSVVGPSYTQVSHHHPQTHQLTNNESALANKKEMPDKELLRPLFKSTRVLSDHDIQIVSQNMGSNWRDVGSRLMFNWSQLDQFQEDTKSTSEAAFKMLYRWLQEKDLKATVGKLCKALFMADEFDAILVMSE